MSPPDRAVAPAIARQAHALFGPAQELGSDPSGPRPRRRKAYVGHNGFFEQGLCPQNPSLIGLGRRPFTRHGFGFQGQSPFQMAALGPNTDNLLSIQRPLSATSATRSRERIPASSRSTMSRWFTEPHSPSNSDKLHVQRFSSCRDSDEVPTPVPSSWASKRSRSTTAAPPPSRRPTSPTRPTLRRQRQQQRGHLHCELPDCGDRARRALTVGRRPGLWSSSGNSRFGHTNFVGGSDTTCNIRLRR